MTNVQMAEGVIGPVPMWVNDDVPVRERVIPLSPLFVLRSDRGAMIGPVGLAMDVRFMSTSDLLIGMGCLAWSYHLHISFPMISTHGTVDKCDFNDRCPGYGRV